MRHRHYIKANETCETPQQALWFDTETKPHIRPDGAMEHRLWFGWLRYQRRLPSGKWSAPEYHRFTSARAFWRIVDGYTRPRTRLYLFCHNTNFDLPVLKAFSIPPRIGYTLHRAVIDAPPTIVHYRKGSSTLVLLDTLNFWRVPLAKLGEAVGLPKLTMPPDSATGDAWNEYATRDVDVIAKACLEWWQFLIQHDAGGFAPTLAGQALKTWRHKYMHHKVLIDDNETATNLSRLCYLGGRTEVFRHGKLPGTVRCVDVNSMYMSVMRGNPYPVVLLGHDAKFPEQTYNKYHRTHATLARVKLRTDEPFYPCLVNNRLCFPVGTFWAYLAGPELSMAVERGAVIEWAEVVVYKQAEIFTPFVDDLYSLRLAYAAQGNEVYSYFCKTEGNSLYGKFGQRGMVWEEATRTDDLTSKAWLEYDVTTGKTRHCRQLAGLVQVKSENGESRESFPAIAAYVTSYARVKLLTYMRTAGLAEVYYVDTDSLFVSPLGFERLKSHLHQTNLGMLKLEKESDSVTIRGVKDYTFGKTTKVKGVRKSALWLTDSEVRQEQWSGLRGQLSRGDLDNATTKQVTKRLSRKYEKGTFLPDGKVAPMVLSE